MLVIAKAERPVPPTEPVKSRVFLPPEDPIVEYRRAGLSVLNQVMFDLPELIEVCDVASAIDKWLGRFSVIFQEIKHLLSDREKTALRRDLMFLDSIVTNTDAKEMITPVLQELLQEENAVQELTYNLYVLNNFRRIDLEKPRKLSNLRMIRRFTNSIDEEWFVMTHCACAALAEQLVEEVMLCLNSAFANNGFEVACRLHTISNYEIKMAEDLERVYDACDLQNFSECVFPFLKGFNLEENPLFQILDAFYGVQHSDKSRGALKAIRRRMSPSQIRAIEIVEAMRCPVHDLFTDYSIRSAFNRAVEGFCLIRNHAHAFNWNCGNNLWNENLAEAVRNTAT